MRRVRPPIPICLMPCVRACALGGVPLRVPAAIDNVSQYFSQLGQATVLDLQELCMEVAERSLTEDEACETARKGVVEAWKDDPPEEYVRGQKHGAVFPLYIAARNGKVDTVRALLQRGAEVDQLTDSGRIR